MRLMVSNSRLVESHLLTCLEKVTPLQILCPSMGSTKSPCFLPCGNNFSLPLISCCCPLRMALEFYCVLFWIALMKVLKAFGVGLFLILRPCCKLLFSYDPLFLFWSFAIPLHFMILQILLQFCVSGTDAQLCFFLAFMVDAWFMLLCRSLVSWSWFPCFDALSYWLCLRLSYFVLFLCSSAPLLIL